MIQAARRRSGLEHARGGIAHQARASSPPYAVIVYAGAGTVTHKAELVRRGAADATASREQLINTVLRTLGRAPESPADLSR